VFPLVLNSFLKLEKEGFPPSAKSTEKIIRVRNVYLYDLEALIWTPGPELPHAGSEIYGINYDGTLHTIISDVGIIKFSLNRREWQKVFSYGLFDQQNVFGNSNTCTKKLP